MIKTPSDFRQEQLSDPWNPYDINEYPDLVERYPDYDKSKPLPDFFKGWKPREYQLPTLAHLDTVGAYDNAQATSIWHRRAGKTLTTVHFAAYMALMKRVGLVCHVFPKLVQGRRVVWRGRDSTGKPFMDAFPQRYITSRNNHDMMLQFSNGSIYQIVGTDGPNLDALVGSNSVGLIMDEYSIQNPQAWEYLAPILVENGGWVWFVYTPRGKTHGYKLFNSMMAEMTAKNPKVHCELLTILDTGAVTMESARSIQRSTGMSEEKFQQEFMCSFDAALENAYYAELLRMAEKEKRITKVPYDPRFRVHTSWDLGMNDINAIWCYQLMPSGSIHVIDYIEGRQKGMDYYFKQLREKPYVYDRHVGPHDLSVKEYTSGEPRWKYAKRQGFDFMFDKNKKGSVQDGIAAVRAMLPRCYFDATKCERGINALKCYVAEEDAEADTLKKPEHNWASNAADSIRYFAMQVNKIYKKSIIKTTAEAIEAIHNWNVLE